MKALANRMAVVCIIQPNTFSNFRQGHNVKNPFEERRTEHEINSCDIFPAL